MEIKYINAIADDGDDEDEQSGLVEEKCCISGVSEEL